MYIAYPLIYSACILVWRELRSPHTQAHIASKQKKPAIHLASSHPAVPAQIINPSNSSFSIPPIRKRLKMQLLKKKRSLKGLSWDFPHPIISGKKVRFQSAKMAMVN
jgi:hypothetical protein